MEWKQLLAGVLTGVTLLGQAPALAIYATSTAVSAPIHAASAAFPDVSDAKTSEAVELLRLLGVVNGTGSGYNPAGTLSRAEFCKMAVEIMGKGDQEPANRNRTIFRDVGPNHWARGYINLASSIPMGGSTSSGGTGSTGGATTPGKDPGTSTDRLIMGVGNGNFEPDSVMTVGAAVAMLTRILGYSNADVAIGTVWYDGYLAIARECGLMDGLPADGSANLSRGDAAILFRNLLFAKSKGTDTRYLTTLKCKLVEEPAVILSATAATNGSGMLTVQTPGKSYKTKSLVDTAGLVGTRTKLLLDKDDQILLFLPNEGDSIRRVSVLGVPQANALPVAGDAKIDVTLKTKFLKGSDETTYEKVWTGLRTGTPLVLCYNSTGTLDYIFQPTADLSAQDATVMVVKEKPNGTYNPFAALMGGEKNCTIYKNGAPATVADLQQYDVGIYDKVSNILNVSDLRLTGYYENAYPNADAPATIYLMGAERTVLPSAIADLAKFRVGDRITVLLTSNGEIAGAVDPAVAKSTAVGVAAVKGGKATITLLDGVLKLEGSTTASDTLNGALVNVTSSKPGFLNLSRITGSGTGGALNIAQRTLDGKALAAGVTLYEQVGNGPMAQIKLEDITCPLVPAERITYVSYDASGKVNRMVLNDVTGDRYYYGIVRYTPAGMMPSEGTTGSETTEYKNGTITVESSRKDNPKLIVGSAEARNGEMGGIAPSLDQRTDGYKLAAYVPLQSMTGLHRAAFDMENKLVSTAKATFPIAKDVVCYNNTTKQWIPYTDSALQALELALAYSNDLTVYYDKAPEDGGKIRIVVVA